jgi:hypothetical protein
VEAIRTAFSFPLLQRNKPNSHAETQENNITFESKGLFPSGEIKNCKYAALITDQPQTSGMVPLYKFAKKLAIVGKVHLYFGDTKDWSSQQ